MSASPGWLKSLLQLPDLKDICFNGHRLAFVDCGEGFRSLPTPWSEDELKRWILDKLSEAGKTWDARFPFVDLVIAEGFRLHAVFPPICAEGLVISLRKLAQAPTQDPQTRWKECTQAFSILRNAVREGRSILICGSTGSGKTTLATDLLSCVAESERIIALEDTPELRPQHPHFLSLVSRPPNTDGFGGVGLRDLLRQSLRMRPDRLVLGECRGAEVLDLLQILNTGHRGALATLHASSPRDALRRVELLCHLNDRTPLAPQTIRELFASGIDLIAYLEGRCIRSLAETAGLEAGIVLLRPVAIS